MASQGPNSPGTAANDTGVGTVAWSNINNIKVEDAAVSYTSFSSGGTVYSNYAKATGFGFSIPSGATIDGIQVDIKRKASISNASYNASDNIVKMVKGGTVVGTNKAVAGNWSTTLAYTTYGGATDLWGESWTDTDINGSTFGAVLSCKMFAIGKSYDSTYFDHIRITVYYTAGGGGGSSTNALLYIGN